MNHLIFRVSTTPLGQKVLCQPISFSLLVAASVSPSLPPGPQTALTHLLEASLHHLSPSAVSSITLPPRFDCGAGVGGGVVSILLLRLADCLVPGGERFMYDNRTGQERKLRKGLDANLSLEHDPTLERGLPATMDEDSIEGENTDGPSTESTSLSFDDTNITNAVVDSEVAGGGANESSLTNDSSLQRVVDNVGMERRLALFLHKRDDESPHEVCPEHIAS